MDTGLTDPGAVRTRSVPHPTRRPGERPVRRLGALLVASLLAGACSGGPTGGPGAGVAHTASSGPPGAVRTASSGPPGAAPTVLLGVDVPFLTALVAHNQRTLEIVHLSEGRLVDPELRTLAAAVAATEADELRTARTWLRAAGRPTSGGHDHHGHADAADLARLREAAPADVDRVLRTVLVEHQRAAADLARAHRAVGGSAPVRALADRVARSRTAQAELLAAGAVR
ncbi:DUF305 domain-containing protein [Salinispora arenicola]|uniref:Uncharacterized protein (DUF305 family) n=1 Tax=Salinispora arenicola TaxID=168697 RepID=A0A542XUT2_SALAC|nr:DUF305 domain-containing protein [Salinispora arenicola]TQL39600.1 uncharacterized protein (DUF305 family) [Salinispora arenicola]